MNLTSFYAVAISLFEALGVIVIIVGLLLSAAMALVGLIRGEGTRAAVTTLRNVLGGAILLGLEIFVAADLVRTITEEPTVANALALLVIVLVRTLLSWTIQIEIDGMLPWNRALFTSGAVVAARALTKPAEK
jgi:uncharacterized membrane protein